MRHKMTKAETEKELARVSMDRDLHMLALHDVINGSVTWGTWEREDGYGKYQVGISRVDSPSGGLVILAYRSMGEAQNARKSLTVHYLERFDLDSIDAMRSGSTWTVPCRTSLANARAKLMSSAA